MRRVGLAAIMAFVVAVGMHARQREFQFFVSMVDGSGTPVAGVTPADLQVSENGAPGKVLKMEPIDWPIKVQVLVDNGAGMGAENLIHLRNGVRGLIEALPLGVEVSLLSTAPQPRFLVRATIDRAEQLKGVDVLTPDSGAGRFTESMREAAQRIERDESNHFPVIVAVGTTAVEAGNNSQRDIQQMLERLGEHAATAHIVMLSSSARGSIAVGNAMQVQVGNLIKEVTGGRYEAIAAPSRLATLLPEIGAQVAQSHALQSRQYRVTFERPAAVTGAIGAIGLGARAGLRGRLSLDGHLP